MKRYSLTAFLATLLLALPIQSQAFFGFFGGGFSFGFGSGWHGWGPGYGYTPWYAGYPYRGYPYYRRFRRFGPYGYHPYHLGLTPWYAYPFIDTLPAPKAPETKAGK